MIDTYTSSSCFIFRKGSTEVGRAPFATLNFEATEAASDSDIDDARFYLGEYVAGEKLKNPTVILGPPREFTHEVTLHAAGNPDFRQYTDIGPKKTVRCVGTEEAVAIVKAYQTRYDMGGGNCAKDHGIVWELPKGGKGKRKKAGEVTYGGRFWTTVEKAKWEAEMKAKYGAPTSEES